MLSRTNSTNLLILAATALLSLCSAARAQVLYVDDDAPSGGDGQSWNTAYRYLQDALATANTPGGGITEVRVAQGIYYTDQSAATPEGTHDYFATFFVAEGFALRGGYAGVDAPDPDARDFDLYESILSGEINSALLNFDNSFHVATGSGDSLLEGFTVRGGYSGANWTPPQDRLGGGLLVVGGTFTAQSCTFFDNRSFTGGGAALTGGTLTLVSCEFIGNTAVTTTTASVGSAVAALNGSLSMLDCIVGPNPIGDAAVYTSNSTVQMTGSSFDDTQIAALSITGGTCNLYDCEIGNLVYLDTTSAEVTNSQFDAAGIDEAGIDATNTSLSVTSTIFQGNGRGVRLQNSNLIAASCEFLGNHGVDNGGAVESLDSVASFADCTFVDNRSDIHGGAVYGGNSDLTFTQCDFALSGAFDQVAMRGGFIGSRFGSLTVDDCTFESSSNELIAAQTGGAIWVDDADENPIVTNSSFIRMRSAEGGAMDITVGSSPDRPTSISNCVFEDCAAESPGGSTAFGGAIVSIGPLVLDGCTFTGGVAHQGGAANCFASFPETIVVQNCTFANNRGVSNGGLLIGGETAGLVRNCTFINNRSGGTGAFAAAFGAHVRAEQCLFLGNSANTGGAVSAQGYFATLEMVDCILVGNSARETEEFPFSDARGGVAWIHDATASFIHCTIVGNSAESEGSFAQLDDDAVVTMNNCILWDNADAMGDTEDSLIFSYEDGNPDDDPVFSINYSIIEGMTGAYGGVGNLDANPMFIAEPDDGGDGFGDNLDTPDIDESANDDYGDLHLQLTSPAIDAGWNNAVTLDVNDIDDDGDVNEFVPYDLDGLSRFAQVAEAPDSGCGVGAIVDMGAYEFQGVPMQPTYGRR